MSMILDYEKLNPQYNHDSSYRDLGERCICSPSGVWGGALQKLKCGCLIYFNFRPMAVNCIFTILCSFALG